MKLDTHHNPNLKRIETICDEILRDYLRINQNGTTTVPQ